MKIRYINLFFGMLGGNFVLTSEIEHLLKNATIVNFETLKVYEPSSSKRDIYSKLCFVAIQHGLITIHPDANKIDVVVSGKNISVTYAVPVINIQTESFQPARIQPASERIVSFSKSDAEKIIKTMNEQK